MLLTLRNHLENALHRSRNNRQTNLIRIPFLLSQCNNLLLMAVTKRNSNIALILFFLYRLTNVSGNVLSSFLLFSSRCAKIPSFPNCFVDILHETDLCWRISPRCVCISIGIAGRRFLQWWKRITPILLWLRWATTTSLLLLRMASLCVPWLESDLTIHRTEQTGDRELSHLFCISC